MEKLEKEVIAAPFFAVRRLTHVNLNVSDIDSSIAFYRDVVGLGLAWRRETMRTGFLNNGNTHHDVGLIDVRGPLGDARGPSLNHLAFELETQTDLVDGYNRAVSAGISFEAMHDHEISHSLYYKDAEGNHVEIYADTEVDWRTRHIAQNKPKLTEWAPGVVPPSSKRYYDPDPIFARLEKSLFHAKKVTHVVLAVEHLRATCEEYMRLFSMRLVMGGPELGFASLAGTSGDRDVTLLQADETCARGLHHFGFVVWDAEDLADSVERARAAGIDIEAEVDRQARHSVMIRDPDGFRVQLYADSGPLSAHEVERAGAERVHLV